MTVPNAARQGLNIACKNGKFSLYYPEKQHGERTTPQSSSCGQPHAQWSWQELKRKA